MYKSGVMVAGRRLDAAEEQVAEGPWAGQIAGDAEPFRGAAGLRLCP